MSEKELIDSIFTMTQSQIIMEDQKIKEDNLNYDKKFCKNKESQNLMDNNSCNNTILNLNNQLNFTKNKFLFQDKKNFQNNLNFDGIKKNHSDSNQEFNSKYKVNENHEIRAYLTSLDSKLSKKTNNNIDENVKTKIFDKSQNIKEKKKLEESKNNKNISNSENESYSESESW